MQDELNILQEVGNTAAGNAASALSNFLDTKIDLHIPSVDIINVPSEKFLNSKDVPKNIKLEKIETAIFSNISTGLSGGVIFILDEQSILKLVDLSYKPNDENPTTSSLIETGFSLIRDIGNIIIGSYLTAMDSMFSKTIIPAFPTLMNGVIDDILYLVFSLYGSDDYACLIETIFEEPQKKIKGGFYLILSPEGIAEVKNICKKILQA